MSHLREFPIAVDGYETMGPCALRTRPAVEEIQPPPQAQVFVERAADISRPFVLRLLLPSFRLA